jgi:hypothetical protein
MKPTKLLIGLAALSLLLGACNGDGESPTATPTPPDLYLPSTFYERTLPATVTPRPVAARTPVPVPAEWDGRAVWQDYDIGDIYEDCYGQRGVDCLVEVAAATGVSPEAIAFIEQNQWILVSFEELGTVDFGQVAWLSRNMGRPEPVLLNGDSGVIHYRDVIPGDWSAADPSYAGLADVPARAHPPWGVASRVAEAYSDGPNQHVTVETLITFCGPCPKFGFLPLQLTFDQGGRLVTTTVLPLRCESEAFYWIEPEEGPCAAD